MVGVEGITRIINLNLNLRCKSQVHLIIVMHTYLLKELYHLKTLQSQAHPQIIQLKKVIIKNCVPITDCINETNTLDRHYAKDIDVVIPMCNLI